MKNNIQQTVVISKLNSWANIYNQMFLISQCWEFDVKPSAGKQEDIQIHDYR